MSYPARTPLPSHLRQPHAPTRTTSSSSAGASAPTAATSVAGQQQPPHPAPTGQSAALAARIGEKKAELEGLRELRGLSAALAGQMQALEDKLGTLAGGTEAVAAVLANWHNVLRAINLASMKIPKPQEGGDAAAAADAQRKEPDLPLPLPQTLVRIPTQQNHQGPKNVDYGGD